MNVFLSWSGNRSKAAAAVFRTWIPYLINAVKPWMSEKDIAAGARWSDDIRRQLEETRFGLLFVTPSNVAAPWLLFEAGALAKTIEDTYVCPYLLGLGPRDLPAGPLTQFQAKVADKADTKALVETMNQALEERALPDEQIANAFDKWWPVLEKKLSALPAETKEAVPPRTTDDVLEEILTVVRRLDQREARFLPFPNESDRDLVEEFWLRQRQRHQVFSNMLRAAATKESESRS